MGRKGRAGLSLCGWGKPPSGAALDDEEFVEAAFDGAVEEGRAFGGSQADELRRPKVSGEEIHAPADACLLYTSPSPRD